MAPFFVHDVVALNNLMFYIRLLDSKFQFLQRKFMPTVLSAFTALTLIHVNNVGANNERRDR